MSVSADRPTGLGRPLREVLDRIDGHPERRLARSGLFLAATNEIPDTAIAALLDLLATSLDEVIAAVMVEVTGDPRLIRIGGSAISTPDEISDAVDDVFHRRSGPAPRGRPRPALLSTVTLPRGCLSLAVWRATGEFTTTERARFIAIRNVAAATLGA